MTQLIHTDPVAELKELIRQKEQEHDLEEAQLRATFHETYESLKPINLIKNTIRQAIASPELKGNLGNAALGLATGFVAKKLISLGSNNPIVKLGATAVEMLVASKVTAHADDIKAIASIVLNKFLNHQRASADENITG
jgi:hypothetical protein